MLDYPNNDLENARVHSSYLGSFWSKTYDGAHEVRALLQAMGIAELDVHEQIIEAASCGSPETIQAFARRRVRIIRLRESDQNGRETGVLQYGGEDAVYGVQSTTGVEYAYGEPYSRSTFSFPRPASLVGVACLVDRVQGPMVSLVQGVDFVLGDETLEFRSSPFENELLQGRILPVFENGAVVDQELTLFAVDCQLDLGYLEEQYGYIYGVPGDSSPAKQRLLALLNRALAGGSARAHIEALLALTSGFPIGTKEDQTPVQVITPDSRSLLICTETSVHRLPIGTETTAVVDEPIPAGRSLSTDVTVYSLTRGQSPPLDGLSIGRGVLSPSFAGDLFFSADPEEWNWEEDAGRAKLSFVLGGLPAEAEAFWDAVHARGLAGTKTLAQYVDSRANPDGDPDANNLQPLGSPLDFLCANLLRNNTLVVVVQAGQLGEDALGLSYLRFLPQIVPPDKLVLLVIVLPQTSESGTIGSADDSFDLGYAAEEIAEDGSMAGEGPIRIKSLAGACI